MIKYFPVLFKFLRIKGIQRLRLIGIQLRAFQWKIFVSLHIKITTRYGPQMIPLGIWVARMQISTHVPPLAKVCIEQFEFLYNYISTWKNICFSNQTTTLEAIWTNFPCSHNFVINNFQSCKSITSSQLRIKSLILELIF